MTATGPTHFYPRPPRGGRHSRHIFLIPCKSISIHALREEGDAFLALADFAPKNFYPRPPRGGRRHEREPAHHPDRISIHALREEGDKAASGVKLAGGTFLSTPSARRATRTLDAIQETIQFLSTPSARRATCEVKPMAALEQISIHALREEGDRLPLRREAWQADFYPRPPRGGRPADP